jgi:hypothetical protein
MTKKGWLYNHRKTVWLMIASVFIAVSFSQHIIRIWDQKAILMFGVLLVSIPLTAWGLSFVFPKFTLAFQQMKSKQALYIVSAIILSIATTWILFRAPSSYQNLTITPHVSPDQHGELLEIKVNGVVLQMEEQAVEHGWDFTNGILTATQNSKPLVLSLKLNVNSPVTVLFNSSQERGEFDVSLGLEERKVLLSSSIQGQQLVTFRSGYRMLPNWLFIAFSIISDVFTFFLLYLVLFILQEKGQQYFSLDTHERFLSTRICLLILTILTLSIHTWNALSVPLFVSADTPVYLDGAIHLIKYGNFEKVSFLKGPGSALLFAPIVYIFGRNPWGMKIYLHLFAIACVFLGYRIGWQLSRKRWVAFTIGFLIMLMPDLYAYSNVVYSDVPNIFLLVLFTSLILDAYHNFSFRRVLPALLVGSFATLFRDENILLLVSGTFFLGLQPGWNWLKGVFKKKEQKRLHVQSLGMLLIAFLLALLPLFWWSFRNLKVHGFFGLTYRVESILYDSWVYFAEASGLQFYDENSSAVQTIHYTLIKYPPREPDKSGVATMWDVFTSLTRAGYSYAAAHDLIMKSTWDSIASHWKLIPTIFQLKFRGAFRPEIFFQSTLPLPGDIIEQSIDNNKYFDPVTLSLSPLIVLQRAFYDFCLNSFFSIYRIFILFSLAAMFFVLYQKPFKKMLMLAVFASIRIFLPFFVAIALWRYTAMGIILLIVFGVIAVSALLYGVKNVLFNQKIYPSESKSLQVHN